jgi:hypothetical protein
VGSVVQVADSLLLESLSSRVESEGEKEVVHLFEVLSEGVDLVDDVFDALDSVLSESLFDDLVGAQGNSLSVELSESSLVDEMLDGLSAGESVGDIGLDSSEHVHSGLVVFDEHGVAHSEESEEREDLSLLGSDFGESLDSDDQEIRALLLNEELVVEEGLSLLLDKYLGLFLQVLSVFSSLLKGVAGEFLRFLNLEVLGFLSFVFQSEFLLLFLLKAHGHGSW